MSAVETSAVTLRIHGDDLVPQEITRMLGVSPTHAVLKGQEIVGQKTGRIWIAKSGMWRLCAADRNPENVDAQIQELFSRMTADIAVWRSIAKKYKMDLFCGLFMREKNDGLSISPQSMTTLAERGIELWFDIYTPTNEVRLKGS